MKIHTTKQTRKMLKDCKDQICVELTGDDILDLIKGTAIGEGYLSDIIVIHGKNKGFYGKIFPGSQISRK